MKSFTRAISNIIKSQPYQSGRYFDKDNIMILNELGDTFYYDKTTHDCTLRVNGVGTVLLSGAKMSDEMLVSLNGQLINQKILLLNFVQGAEIKVTVLAATADGDANPNDAFSFAGAKPTLLLDDRYSANGDVDAMVFYCIKKNGRYFLAKRLFSENFENEHLLFTIDKAHYESPDRISFSFNTEYSGMYRIKKDDAVVTPPGPIACIPTTRSFINNPINYNLVVSAVLFYAIVESQGKRFFLQAHQSTIPVKPVVESIYYDKQKVQADVTAALSINVFLTPQFISTNGFDKEYVSISRTDPYMRVIDEIVRRYDVKSVAVSGKPILFTALDGYTTTSTVPRDRAELGWSFHAEPYSIKFVHATADEIQRYRIGRYHINIIDYMNNGNELEALSCAWLGKPADDGGEVNPVPVVDY